MAALKKLKECHKCKTKVFSRFTVKISQVSIDQKTSRVLDLFPICIYCLREQLDTQIFQLKESGNAP